MRLEINSGGLDSFYNGVSSFINSASNSVNSDKLIKSIKKVADTTNNIAGGVGTLASALGNINTRIVKEESRKFAVQNVKTQTDNFIQTAIRVDNAVAKIVKISNESFYKTNPWLRPPKPASDWDKFWGTVGDIANICWEGVVKFYNDHPIISKIIIGTVALAATIALTVGTLGIGCAVAAMIPLLCGVGASVAVGAVVGGIFDGGWEGALNGAADGFMFGGIAALADFAFGSAIVAAVVGGGVGGVVDGALSSDTWEGAISEGFIGGLTGFASKSVMKILSKSKACQVLTKDLFGGSFHSLPNNIDHCTVKTHADNIIFYKSDSIIIVKQSIEDILDEVCSTTVEGTIRGIKKIDENFNERLNKSINAWIG